MGALKAPDGVELAKPEDESGILDLLRLKYEEETGTTDFPLTQNRNFIRLGLAGRNGCIGIVRGNRGMIEASVGLFVGNWCGQVTADEHLYDRWLFVHPRHRRTQNAHKLIDFARYVSDYCGRPWLSPHIINERTATKSAMYERAMGGAFAFIYLHDPNGRMQGRKIDPLNKKISHDLDKMSNNARRRLSRFGIAPGLALSRREA